MPLRLRALPVVICLLSLASPASAAMAPRVINGQPAGVDAVPWGVWLKTTTGPSSVLQCSGSILDATHIATAAHCVVAVDGASKVTPYPASQVQVGAGATSWKTPGSTPGAQLRTAKALRVHPYYDPRTSPGPGGTGDDDVAVVELASPLDLTKPTAQAIALAPAWRPGDQLLLAGWGAQSAVNGTFDGDGTLRLLTVGALDRACASPTGVCVQAPNANGCHGDSGGGLATTAGTPQLVAIEASGPQNCDVGKPSLAMDVTAPEIRDFLTGAAAPPRGPRYASGITIRTAALTPGGVLTCDAGVWSGGPAFTYAFEDGATGAAVQDGPANAYSVQATDVGRQLRCRARATNAGGTAEVITENLPAVPAPSASALAPVSLRIVGVTRARRRHTVRVTIALRSASAQGVYVCAGADRRRLRASRCRTFTVRPGIERRAVVKLVVTRRARLGRARVSITARGADGRRVTARTAVRIRRR